MFFFPVYLGLRPAPTLHVPLMAPGLYLSVTYVHLSDW